MKKIFIVLLLFISFAFIFVHAEETDDEDKAVINSYNRTITYKGRSAAYRIGTDYIEVEYNGCTYIKQIVDDMVTTWGVVGECDDYRDSEIVNKMLDAIDEKDKSNIMKYDKDINNDKVRVNKKIVISLVITVIMALIFVYFAFFSKKYRRD